MTIGQHVGLTLKHDADRNRQWRLRTLAELKNDRSGSLAHDLWHLCSEDILFYLSGFVCIHEPRLKRARNAVVPFLTWDYQDEAIAEIVGHIEEGRDLCEYKSRDMGASWLNLACIEWMWHFRPALSFALVSRNADYVDDPGNKKALFQKIDFIHQYLPQHLRPNMNRVKMHLSNLDNGSTIDGESTTGKVARGDRRTAILLDEFAAFETSDGFSALSSTQFATDCRLFNSTFETTADAFYAVYTNPEIDKIQLPWWNHPLYKKGLYLDTNGKKRSPWYDQQCAKASDPRIIARELDMNPEGAQAQFFSQSEIEKLIVSSCRKPDLVGDIDFDTATARNPRFNQRDGGKLKLWIEPTDGQIDQNRSFSIGVDIATGTGASNSSISVTDSLTGIKVAEWTDQNTRPDQLAHVTAALARWFNDSLVVPEAAGPGRNFIDVLMHDLQYGNIYFRENERAFDKKRSLVPGWWPTPEAKWSLFSEYRRALVAGQFTNPSEPALRECLDYVYFSATIWHSAALAGNDPSGARDNHGDRPTADALSWKGVRYAPVTEETKPKEVSRHSIAGRRMMMEQHRRERELAWD